MATALSERAAASAAEEPRTDIDEALAADAADFAVGARTGVHPATAAVDAASGEAYEAAAEQALGAQLASLGRDGGVLLRRGRPAATIVDVATEIGASLVVVGRHRMNALERIVLGSTAEEVAAHAPCSVLLVQPPGELPSP